MKNIETSQSYCLYLVEKIVNEIFPCFELWSLRSLENRRYEYISGSCDEIEKFTQFITEYGGKSNQPKLLLVVGNGEKKYPSIMLNTSKKYSIIKFDTTSDSLGQLMIIPEFLSRG